MADTVLRIDRNNDELYYIGVDVGTGSVRAALVTHAGSLAASSVHDIKTFRSQNDHRIFEQSTTDIWSAICACVREVLKWADIPSNRVRGIGFDATCSLAVVDWEGRPITVTIGDSLGQEGTQNVILWADHRAEEEARTINGTGSVALDFVGGTTSLEMELPKILWLKNYMDSSRFHNCQFFDLPDYLTYRATGNNARSACSLTCKCGFLPERDSSSGSPSGTATASQHENIYEEHPKDGGWSPNLLRKVGLAECVENGYKQLGGAKGRKDPDVLTAGMPVGNGLSEQAAKELGLEVGTPVGSAVIDAYAGWLGTIAARHREETAAAAAIGGGAARHAPLSPLPTLEDSHHRLAAVAGTSSCYLVQTPTGVFVPGVWGPYKDAVFPGWWFNEGGQSSTGQLIDFMLKTHPAYGELEKRAKEENTNTFALLHDQLTKLREEAGVESDTELTKDLHLYPDLHGNRSPIADPRMKGSIMGLTLDSSLNSLSKLFHATLTALALQTRHILSTINEHRALASTGNDNGNSGGDNGLGPITAIHLSGGQARNRALVQLLADVCDVDVVLPASVGDAVSRGAAVLGRFAAEEVGLHENQKTDRVNERGERLWEIMVEMTPPGTVVKPAASAREKRLLDAKYKIFLESIEIQQRWRAQMLAAV